MEFGHVLVKAWEIIDEIEGERKGPDLYRASNTPDDPLTKDQKLDATLNGKLQDLVSGLPERDQDQLKRHHELIFVPFFGDWASYFHCWRGFRAKEPKTLTWNWLEQEIQSIATAKKRMESELARKDWDKFIEENGRYIDQAEALESRNRIEEAFAMNLAIQQNTDALSASNASLSGQAIKSTLKGSENHAIVRDSVQSKSKRRGRSQDDKSDRAVMERIHHKLGLKEAESPKVLWYLIHSKGLSKELPMKWNSLDKFRIGYGKIKRRISAE